MSPLELCAKLAHDLSIVSADLDELKMVIAHNPSGRSLKERMLSAIRDQEAQEFFPEEVWILKNFNPEQLALVKRFIRSFNA